MTTRAGQLSGLGLGRIELQQFGQGIRPGLVHGVTNRHLNSF
jgi:hypothetical protein